MKSVNFTPRFYVAATIIVSTIMILIPETATWLPTLGEAKA